MTVKEKKANVAEGVNEMSTNTFLEMSCVEQLNKLTCVST